MENYFDLFDDHHQAPVQVSRVAIKLPAFWHDKPATWFTVAEAQFALQGITADATRYYHIVAALDQQVTSHIDDVLANPPAEDKYQHLKTTLISRLSLSTDERMRQILYKEALDDRKPSQFLRHLRSLGGTTPIPDDVLRPAWINRLPHVIHPILNAHLNLSLDELAKVADRVMEGLPGTSSCSAISSPSLEGLANNVELLTKQIAALQAGQSKSNQRQRPQLTQKRGATNQNSRTQGFCYYHRRFGHAARKCETPCTFQQSGNDMGSQQ